MKHKYTNEQLQAAIDLAVAQYLLNTVCALPETYREKWAGERSARLDLIKSALAGLPEPLVAEHKALTADEWAERWQAEVDARNRQYNELECTRAIAEKALTELAKTKENGLSQLRPIAEAGEVPEGCVRHYTYKKDGEWTTATKHRAMQDTHYIDTRLPEPEPLVTKPISLPLAECMSLRDWFAGQALAGLLVNQGAKFWDGDARNAYAAADAMIKEREVKP